MPVWILALSWTLIYSLGQGLLLFAALWILLKMMPGIASALKYNLALLAISILFIWFGITWWQQFNSLAAINAQINTSGTVILQQWQLDNLHPKDTKFAPIFSLLNNLLSCLPVLYSIGLSLMLLRLSLGMFQLFSLKNKLVTAADKVLQDLFDSLQNKLNNSSNARLLISLKAQVPMVIGFFKPIILLPAASVVQLSTEQLETILLHELAHIKRNDYFVNILQTIIETILFFNPFVWLISAIIRREREHCCDDLVLAHTKEPLYYASALAALASPSDYASGLLVAAAGQSPYHLFHRIKRILEMKKNPFSYSRMVAAILIITVVSGSIVWLTPSFAHNKKQDKNLVQAAPEKVKVQDDKEEMKLVRLLSNDKLIDERKGFTIERKNDQLYIDYKLQSPELAAKYLPEIKKKELKVEVYPFKERIKRHPGTGLLQLSVPIILSSPCVDVSPKKEGC